MDLCRLQIQIVIIFPSQQEIITNHTTKQEDQKQKALSSGKIINKKHPLERVHL